MKWIRVFLYLSYLCPLVWLGWRVQFSANPVEFLLIHTGEFAVYFLIICLWLSPLRIVLGNRISLLKRLMPYRRSMGITVFMYAFLHLGIHVLDVSDLEILVTDLQKIFILSGFCAFLILLALAITSNNFSVKKLSAKRWKWLHRSVYIAACLIFLHMILKEKSDPLQAYLLFIPLAFAEAVRLTRWLPKSNLWPRQSSH